LPRFGRGPASGLATHSSVGVVMSLPQLAGTWGLLHEMPHRQGFATRQASRQLPANWREGRPNGQYVAKPSTAIRIALYISVGRRGSVFPSTSTSRAASDRHDFEEGIDR